jgi:hypothetical protein
MSEYTYRAYIVPVVPVYSYSYYEAPQNNKDGTPKYEIIVLPVVAFACGVDEDGYAFQEALELAGGESYLTESSSQSNFLGCYHDADLKLEYFMSTITYLEKVRKNRKDRKKNVPKGDK